MIQCHKSDKSESIDTNQSDIYACHLPQPGEVLRVLCCLMLRCVVLCLPALSCVMFSFRGRALLLSVPLTHGLLISYFIWFCCVFFSIVHSSNVVRDILHSSQHKSQYGNIPNPKTNRNPNPNPSLKPNPSSNPFSNPNPKPDPRANRLKKIIGERRNGNYRVRSKDAVARLGWG
jgi:hypothetical protein